MQIRKYLNGELSTRDMHKLERRALDDPFLMDALEGFEQLDGDQQTNLTDLNNRLKQRVVKRENRIIPWVRLSAAASILIILGAGIWFFTSRRQSVKKELVAQDIKVEKKELPAISAPGTTGALIPEKNSGIAKINTPSRPKAYSSGKMTDSSIVQQLPMTDDESSGVNDKSAAGAEPASSSSHDPYDGLYKPQKDSVATNELIVKEMAERKKANTAKMGEPSIKQKHQAATQTLVQSKVEGVSVTPDDSMTITGIVRGSDGVPITGATVKVVGRSFGAVTDVNGRFVLPDVSTDQMLSVNYIGYSPKKLKVDKDSMSINLEPVDNSLAEVVVVQNKSKDAAPTDAHPRDGWKNFDDYLKTNAQSPDGKSGKVKISFSVAANGSLGQFKIVKSLSDAADKKAIDLLSNGPAWAGGTDGKSKGITVSIKFH